MSRTYSMSNILNIFFAVVKTVSKQFAIRWKGLHGEDSSLHGTRPGPYTPRENFLQQELAAPYTTRVYG